MIYHILLFIDKSVVFILSRFYLYHFSEFLGTINDILVHWQACLSNRFNDKSKS